MAMNIVTITATITASGSSYNWSFQSDYPGFDPSTGGLTLKKTGPTQIIYQLDPASANLYQLVYVNLDPRVCATHEILQVLYIGHAIIIIDKNSAGITGSMPFSLRLVARCSGNIGLPIVSPDPTVDNDPPPTSTIPMTKVK